MTVRLPGGPVSIDADMFGVHLSDRLGRQVSRGMSIPFPEPSNLLPSLATLESESNSLFHSVCEGFHGDERPTKIERFLIATDAFEACAALHESFEVDCDLPTLVGMKGALATKEGIETGDHYAEDGAYGYNYLVIRRIQPAEFPVPVPLTMGEVVGKTIVEIGELVERALPGAATAVRLLPSVSPTAIELAAAWRKAILGPVAESAS